MTQIYTGQRCRGLAPPLVPPSVAAADERLVFTVEWVGEGYEMRNADQALILLVGEAGLLVADEYGPRGSWTERQNILKAVLRRDLTWTDETKAPLTCVIREALHRGRNVLALLSNLEK